MQKNKNKNRLLYLYNWVPTGTDQLLYNRLTEYLVLIFKNKKLDILIPIIDFGQ